MTVELQSTRETKVEYIDVNVRGVQGWATGSGQTSAGYQIELPKLGKRVAESITLSEGTHEFPLTFTLPRGTAPSHAVSPAYAKLAIDVRVAIPWWLDGKYSFVAPVRLPPPDHVERTPLLSRHPFHAKAGEPRIELSLASSTLVAGEAVVGSCALFHVTDSKARELEVTFEPKVHLLGMRRPWSSAGPGWRSSITIPPGKSGEAVPFRIGLPTAITPSLKTATHEIEWFMKVSTGSYLRGTKLWISLPLTIVDARASETLPPLTLAPRVADERVVAAFERFGRTTGMRVLVDEQDRYPDEQPALVREAGDTTIRIGYAYRGEKGTFLVGRVTYPPLGLGLEVTPSSGLRELFSRDIEIDVDAWDKAHHVDARSAEQVVPFLRNAIPGAATGSLVRWTDDEILTERPIGALDEADIASLAHGLDTLANAIMFARAEIKPPVETNVAEWQQLAERWNGHLSIGDLSIHGGTLDLQPVETVLEFDEAGPTTLRVIVGSQQPADGEPTERVRELLANAAKETPPLTVKDGVAMAALPVTALDPAAVRDIARKLRGLLAVIYESGGPYR